MVEKSVKIVLVGNSKVGKTSLLIRYKNDSFMDPNFVVYDGVSANIQDGAVIYRVHLADTSGGDDTIKIRPFQYSKTGVFILCFAVNDSASYNNIQSQWIPEIKPFINNTPLILVGTKSDLKTERCIDLQQAIKLKKDCNAAFYVECSAKDGYGVNNVIRTAIQAHRRACKSNRKLRCILCI